MAEEKVNKVEDVLALGDEITVKVICIDDKGRVDLSNPYISEKKAKKRGSGNLRKPSGGRERKESQPIRK